MAPGREKEPAQMQTVAVQEEQVSESASAKSRLSSLIQQHPLASFYVLAYAISWILWLPLVVSGDDSPTGLGFVLLLLGTLVSAVAGLRLIHGSLAGSRSVGVAAEPPPRRHRAR